MPSVTRRKLKPILGEQLNEHKGKYEKRPSGHRQGRKPLKSLNLACPWKSKLRPADIVPVHNSVFGVFSDNIDSTFDSDRLLSSFLPTGWCLPVYLRLPSGVNPLKGTLVRKWQNKEQ